MLAVGETFQDAQKNLDLSAKYPVILPAAGLYPGQADALQAEEVAAFIREHRSRLAAIGEVGLDFWLAADEEQKDLQRQVFDQFVHLSQETKLPLNVHSRSAGRHVVQRLLEKKARKVQLHAFDGKVKYAWPAVEQGFFFSIPPSVLRSRQKQKLVSSLPLSCLLAETDSPLLGPEHDARNEPANLTLVVQALAEIKKVSPEYVREALQENFYQLFEI